VNFDATVDGRSYRVEVKARNDRYEVAVDGHPLEVDWQDAGGDFASLIIDGHSYQVGVSRQSGGYAVVLDEAQLLVEISQGTRGAGSPAKHGPRGPSKITAPMPGKIVRVLVEPGQQVAAGQGLIVMEAMKMENELRAPRAGRVEDLRAREGQAVETGALLVTLA
jgi:biotin carboxyl carrier protein